MIERMTFLGDVELREGEHGPVAVGYGVRYNKYSTDLGGFVEVMLPGAGAKTILEQDVRALYNHDPNNLLGRKGAGTLRLVNDPFGVRYEIDLPDTQVGRDVQALIARGDIPGSSVGFQLLSQSSATWEKSSQGYPVRQIHEFRMRDLGPVTFPAYTGTEPALRMLAEERSLPYNQVEQAARRGTLGELLEPTNPGEPRPLEQHRIIRRVYR